MTKKPMSKVQAFSLLDHRSAQNGHVSCKLRFNHLKKKTQAIIDKLA